MKFSQQVLENLGVANTTTPAHEQHHIHKYILSKQQQAGEICVYANGVFSLRELIVGSRSRVEYREEKSEIKRVG